MPTTATVLVRSKKLRLILFSRALQPYLPGILGDSGEAYGRRTSVALVALG